MEGSPNLYRNIVAKTAAYTMVPADIGKYFTTRGATTSVTLTLPVVANIAVGWWCVVYVAADVAAVIASNGSADNITTFNDLTADSITIDTSAERIGVAVELMWDGTGWLTFLHVYETATIVVA